MPSIAVKIVKIYYIVVVLEAVVALVVNIATRLPTKKERLSFCVGTPSLSY